MHDISYKTLIGSKPMQITFDKIDGITIIDFQQNRNYQISYESKKWHHIYFFSLLCKGES